MLPGREFDSPRLHHLFKVRKVTLRTQIQSFANDLKINKVEQTATPRELWWSPELDTGRVKQTKMREFVRSKVTGRRVLEVGYAWEGRVIPGSKVLDLYDPRVDEIDYRLDVCDVKEIADESFDFVLCWSVLEHIPKFWLAVAEIQRVLAIGGIVWCAVPSVWPYHPNSSFRGQEINFGGDYWRMTHQAMPALFDRCGEIATWYIPASEEAGDHPKSGWMVLFIGEKEK